MQAAGRLKACCLGPQPSGSALMIAGSNSGPVRQPVTGDRCRASMDDVPQTPQAELVTKALGCTSSAAAAGSASATSSTL